MPKVICIDIDRTLCKETCFTEEDCLKATPDSEAIKLCNDLYNSEFVVIYTGRNIGLANVTTRWLQDNNVHYHAIKFGKTPFDLYIDNDAVTVQEAVKRFAK